MEKGEVVPPSLMLGLPLRVIYLSVCGRIDSVLYSRPLKPRGDSPCQAAGSNEKLKEHINSSIWGHQDENSCQGPARNNWSHNAALLYIRGITGVKQQLNTQVGESAEDWRLWRTLRAANPPQKKIWLSVSSSKQAINVSCNKMKLERGLYLALSGLLKGVRQHFKSPFSLLLIHD